MLMRYHWGTGIGHTYSHAGGTPVPEVTVSDGLEEDPEHEPPTEGPPGLDARWAETEETPQPQQLSDGDPELGLEERENEDLGDASDTSDARLGEHSDDGWDDETFAALHDMYWQ